MQKHSLAYTPQSAYLRSMTTAVLAGLTTGLALIIAIGSQNAYVLRQGLAREHVGVVVLICWVSDLILITAGVAGVHAALQRADVLLVVLRWGGAAFLTAYAVLSLRRAYRGGEALEVDRSGPATIGAVAVTALALTWLNPHVYLDTVLLLGSVAGTYGDARWWFAAGAILGSLVWFVGLGYGARLGHRLLATPTAWRVLDGAIGLMMLGIAGMLVLGD